MNVLLIASLTIRESSRRKLVLTLIIVSVALVALTAWGFHALATLHTSNGKPVAHSSVLTASSQLEVMMAFMFSFVLALGASFLGSLSTGNEIENGTLLAIVPRPLRRLEIVAGKWLGNLVLIGGYAFFIAFAEFGAVKAMTGYFPPHPFIAVGFLIAESAILLTLTMVLSVRISALAAGFATVVLFGIAWISGVIGDIAGALHNGTLQTSTVVVSLLIPTDGLWRAAAFAMQPAILIATNAGGNAGSSNPFFPAGPPATAFLWWCCAWLAVALTACALSFQTRDI